MFGYTRTDVMRIAAISAAYFLAARLGLALSSTYNTITLFWPPSGIALASLLLFGWRVFPAIAIGEFLAILTAGLPVSAVAGISGGNVLEGLLGYYLLRHRSGFDKRLLTLRDVGMLFVFGALISPAVAAANGAWWIMQATGGSWGGYLHTMQYWWMGDALGIALFTPLILAWLRGDAGEWTKQRVRRASLAAGVLVASCVLVFPDLENSLPELGLFFPILIWVALNFNLRCVSFALLLVFLGSMLGLLALGDLHPDRMDALANYVWLYNLLFGVTALGVAVLNGQRDRVEQALRLSEENSKRAQSVGGVGSWQLDIRKNQLEWSEETYRIFGVEAGKPLDHEAFMACVHPDDRGLVEHAWQKAMQGEPYDIKHRILAGEGQVKWVRERAEILFDAQHQAISGTGTVQDITDWKLDKENIQRLAYYDPLTGLPNRSLLHDRLNQAIAVAHRDNERFALMILDLDRFKYINDTLGHQAGDQMLMVIAERLAEGVREGDTISRLGGDEFVVLLQETSAEGALLVAEKFLKSVSVSFEVDGITITTHGSIGICMYPEDGRDVDTLMKNADAAMYHAKDMGRNNAQFFTPQLNEKTQLHFDMERELRLALERKEFELYYQPQIDLSDNSISGMEALLRWKHPQRGMILPAEFIPLAEESDLIVDIGEWVLRTACAQARTWHDQGLPTISIAINLSIRQLRDKHLAKLLKKLLNEANLPHWILELELTESIMLHDAHAAVDFIAEVHGLGIMLSIDDFGIGYSSLGYLKKLSLDKLKIDQSFIRDIDTNPDDTAIVRAIISLAHGLGIRVIAEGVETAGQMEMLRKEGCDEVQGYLISHPQPVAGITDFIRRHSAGMVASIDAA
jgi:diguanylate cyclase (GGDEF)-like protein